MYIYFFIVFEHTIGYNEIFKILVKRQKKKKKSTWGPAF